MHCFRNNCNILVKIQKKMFHSATIKSSASSTSAEFWSSLFSEENRKRAMDDLEKGVKEAEILQNDKKQSFPFVIKPEKLSKMRRAAVLVPLCHDIHGRPSILFTLRSMKLSKHKGEISFPGGNMDKEDDGDPVKCALRETMEELGITKDKIEILMVCPPFPTASSKMFVVPVLGYIKEPIDLTKLTINSDEVEEPFLVPLEHLSNEKNYGSKELFSIDTPVYKNFNGFLKNYQNSEGNEIILWGLTGMLTHIVLRVFVKNGYNLSIPWLDHNLNRKSKL